MDWLRLEPWHWWALGALLLILEVLSPGVLFIWLAVAAFVLGLILVVIKIGVVAQIFLFSIFSLLSAAIGKRYVAEALGGGDKNDLNEGANRLLGRKVTVTTPITNGVGRVKVGDSEWRAAGPDAASGESMIIVDTQGATLIVVKTELSQ